VPEVSILDLPNVLRGNRATRATTFPDYEDGKDIERPCLLVPLTGTEEAEVLSFAAKYAREKGATEAKAGDPLYDLAFMAKSITVGVKTPEGGPFFPSVQHVLDALPRETVVYVFTLLEDWQDACSPSVRKVTDEELWAGVAALGVGGSEGERFFDRQSPGMRRAYALFMAHLLSTSPAHRSPTSSSSTATTTSSLKPLARAKKRGRKL
jgi:hypothetical protein